MTHEQFTQLTTDAYNYVASLPPAEEIPGTDNEQDIAVQRELAALLAPQTGFAPETIVVLSGPQVGPSINDLLASHPHVQLQLPDELKNLLGAPLYAFSIPSPSTSTSSLDLLLTHSQSCITLAMILLAFKSGHITIPNSNF